MQRTQRGRRPGRWVLGALLYVAVAAHPWALGSAEAAPGDARTIRPPTTAIALAARMGMTYQDRGDHVILSDRTTRVRIWSNSNRVAVGGNERQMRGRTERRGGAVVMPGPMADYIEGQVILQRRRLAAIRPPPPRPHPAPAPRAPAHVTPVRRAPAVDPQPERPPATPRPAPGPGPGWVPPASAPPRAWRWIVLHHSDDTEGNLAKYDRIHRDQNGWDECGYHFVIGNGSLSGDGQVEVGTRWPKQKHGAHTKTDDNRFNDFGIGICLVGDFEKGSGPTPAQMESLVHLVRWLMATYGLPASAVVGHCDCKPTACPGRHFPWAEVRRRISD